MSDSMSYYAMAVHRCSKEDHETPADFCSHCMEYIVSIETRAAVAAENEWCARMVENPQCELLSLADVAAAIRVHADAPVTEPSAEEEKDAEG